MAGMKVSVKPEILNWVLQEIQFEDVASSAVELLNKWKSGEKTPTFNQVEDVSRKTRIPFGYFFLDSPPVEDCPIIEYRTVNSVTAFEPSRDLIDTYDQMAEIQDWMADYLQENGYDELDFVGSADVNMPVSKIVEDIRKRLGLRTDWFTSCKTTKDAYKLFRSKIEGTGVLVMANGIVRGNTRRKLNVEEFRAFTIVNKYAPLIFINNNDTETGRLFSVLHEVTHIWLGIDSMYNDGYGHGEGTSGVEKKCNAVAAEILVPNDVFLDKWAETDGTDIGRINTLTAYFHCSGYVIARKALDNHMISRKAYDIVIRELDEQFKVWEEEQSRKKPSGGNYYDTMKNRMDHRLIRALSNSAKEGRTQYTEIYRLTNTNRKTFRNLLEEIGEAG